MRMETNWEDSQLMREAAREAQRRSKRAQQISDTVAEHLGRLRTALREDFQLNDADTATMIISALTEFEQCGAPECTQDATIIALSNGVLACRCDVHGLELRTAN